MRNRPIYALFLLLEAILAFGLGVFGNKVADLLNITSATIILGASGVVCLLYLATLSRLRFEAGESLLPGSGEKTWRIFLINAVLTIFPIGIMSGMFSGLICTLLVPGRRFVTPSGFFIHDYELLTIGIGCVSVAWVATRRPRRSVILMLSIGYALGLGASITVLDAKSNSAVFTFSGLVAIMMAIGLITSSRAYSGWLSGLKSAMTPDEHRKP